jgi:hypothetical protein
MNFSLNTIRIIATAILAVAIFTSCDVVDYSEEDKTYDGELLVKFNSESAILFAEEDTEIQNVGVSTLKPIGEDRTYEFVVVDSLTTAEEGVDYELDSNSFTIAANEVLGSIPVTLFKANLEDAPTLYLRITSENAATFNTDINLTLRQFTPYQQQDWVGDFNLVYPWWYGTSAPQVVTVVADPNNENVLIVQNMLGTGTDIELVMDDSDKTNFTVSFDKESAWVSGTFGPARMAGSGTFDAALLSISAQAEHTVDAGTFGTNPFTMVKIQ